MSDFGAYREKVAALGKQAAQAEDAKDYKLAFELYTKALDIFAHMIKCKSRFPTGILQGTISLEVLGKNLNSKINIDGLFISLRTDEF